MASNYHSPIKRTKAPWRNGQSRAGAGKIQYEPEASYVSKSAQEKKKEEVDISKGHRRQKHFQCSKLGQREQQKYCIIGL